jgi:hypothetical protein
MLISYHLTDYTARLQFVRFLQLDLELDIQCPIGIDVGQSTMIPRRELPIEIGDVKNSLVLEGRSSYKLLERHNDFTHRSTWCDLVIARPDRERHCWATFTRDLERMLWRQR